MAIVEIPYRPRELWKDFHNNKKRWNVIVAHRRAGKTVAIVNELIKGCLTTELERPRFAYIAPFLVQVKAIAWDYAKYYSKGIPNVKFNESELRIDFPNGARLQLLGADNPDRLRGIYLDGVALDEYAQIRPNFFSEIIRPALSDRQGYAVFIGTPKGHNHFYDLVSQADENWFSKIYKASETGIVGEAELEDAKKIMTPDEYAQEYNCSFEAAIKGAFYSDEIAKAKADKRVCKVPYDPNLEVNTAWDIGWTDDTSIIFWQQFGKEIRVIDAYSNSGMTMGEYSKILKDKGYSYGTHYFPHDAYTKRMSDGKSTVDVAREYGVETVNTPQLSVLEGINQARLAFKDMWFDEEKTKDLVNALSQYRREWNEANQTFRANPLHDWSSHLADAFRYMAISLYAKQVDQSKNTDFMRDRLQKLQAKYKK